MSAFDSAAAPAGAARRSAWLAVRVLLVRFRFLFLLAGVLLLVAVWSTLRGWWDRLSRPGTAPGGTVSGNMEYWCPMCPGVVSDCPSKCPVCNMALIRREKGEMAPLPEGIVARMQFSPYRAQLAGIRAAPVEARPLVREVVLVGTVGRTELSLAYAGAEVFEQDLPFLREGRALRAACDALPGHLSFPGEVIAVEPAPVQGGLTFRVRFKLDDPQRELRLPSRVLIAGSLVLLALVAEQNMTPPGYEPVTPLDEGMVMDMPITVPWASVGQATDDLKARDMVLCRFPEVDMVVGKVGRADTPTDPAPLDVIETMVNFRPQEHWPRRKLKLADAERHARAVLAALRGVNLVRGGEGTAEAELINAAVMAALPTFDAQMREFCYQRNQEFERQLGPMLVRAGRRRLLELLWDNGSLQRRLGDADLARLAEPWPRTYPLQLARDLTREDANRLARDTVREMDRQGLLRPGSDPVIERAQDHLAKRFAEGPRLRQAVLDGAVQRLRPKLLTEGTMVLGLAPLLWSDGVGAEVIRAMVIPVLGGILVADELIDLFLPVLFFGVRRWRWQRLQAVPASD
jgi:hypothetical protein